ncbi:precorrin-4 C(11)-methyltransferase [Phocaeicola sp.]
MKAIILISETSLPLAQTIQQELEEATIYSKTPLEGCTPIASYSRFMGEHFADFESIIFIGALGICVRSIADCIKNKYKDPAVVCVDSTGHFVISVLSGHIGGANELTRHIAAITGGEAVITTQSDNAGLWALDTLAKEYGWKISVPPAEMNRLITLFVNQKPTALLLDIKDKGTAYLERTLPTHVKVFYHLDDIPRQEFELMIAVTPYIYKVEIPMLCFRPAVLHLGVGCRKQCNPSGIAEHIEKVMREQSLCPLSLATVNTIELKKNEPLLDALHQQWQGTSQHIYSVEELKDIEVPNPSEKAFEVTGIYGVAESTALKSSGEGPLVLEKQKGVLTEGNHFTFAIAMSAAVTRGGHIEIVGAGPGDPELVSVRGKRMLQTADLILYAGSLVPRELTFYAKEGATVRSSASLALEEQFALMKEFYDRGLFVVRLHTGDPCIYGAIQEQMAFFDRYKMSYHITPGISSFQAAAAALKSQFTIPEKVQSIILTRGEGRTPMPEKEQLHKLAQSQSTMCIYLSAGIAEQVQAELLQAYPPETPVAACYKLTWKEEQIYRGELKDLAKIVRENNLTLTTLLVVGEAIDNRKGLSRLYAHEFKHLFRK